MEIECSAVFDRLALGPNPALKSPFGHKHSRFGMEIRIMHDNCVLLGSLRSQGDCNNKVASPCSLALCVASQREKLDTGISTHTMLKTWADLGTDFPSIEFSSSLALWCVSQENENGIFLFSTPSVPSPAIRANITLHYVRVSMLSYRFSPNGDSHSAPGGALAEACFPVTADGRSQNAADETIVLASATRFSCKFSPPRRINRTNERAEIFCHLKS